MARAAAARRAEVGRPYHHGNLRRELVDAALEELAEHGPQDLSLRALARRAGVSHAAPTHHFGDKAGLLTAIAVEGYELLAESLAGADRFMDPPTSADSPFHAQGLAYI